MPNNLLKHGLGLGILLRALPWPNEPHKTAQSANVRAKVMVHLNVAGVGKEGPTVFFHGLRSLGKRRLELGKRVLGYRLVLLHGIPLTHWQRMPSQSLRS